MSEAPRPRVLLVDDEPRILAALRRTLRREGYELLEAASPGEALRLLEAEPVDAILSDQKMPGMTGLELLERAAARRPDAARLLLTGWTAQVPADAIEAAGIRALLEKPWDPATLRETLRACLRPAPDRPG